MVHMKKLLDLVTMLGEYKSIEEFKNSLSTFRHDFVQNGYDKKKVIHSQAVIWVDKIIEEEDPQKMARMVELLRKVLKGDSFFVGGGIPQI